MILINFINNNPNWKELLSNSPYNLHIQNEDNFWLFKYNQIESDFSNELVQHCRGIILKNENNIWSIVCNPFNKFFNLSEPNAYKIDFKKSVIVEKCDGSLIKLSWNGTKWIISTNGTINAANASTRIMSKTFYDLFMDVMGKFGFDQMIEVMDKSKTYLFELIHPMSRIVVNYGEIKELVFLGYKYNSIDQYELDYLPDDTFGKISFIRLPKFYDINTQNIEDMEKVADSYNESGVDFEGFVIAECNNNLVSGRVKIKSPKYLKLHRLAGNSIYNSLTKLIVDNEISEFKAYSKALPYYVTQIFNEIFDKYVVFVAEVNKYVEKYLPDIEKLPRKDIAISIKTTIPEKYHGYIFQILYKNDNIKSILSKKSPQDIRKLINYTENVTFSENL